MRQFHMLKTIQKKKQLQTKKGKQELGWNERFYLEKIPDYTKPIEPNPGIQQYKSHLGSTKKRIANQKGGIQMFTYEEPEAFFDLDPEMVELWNTLSVTDDYRKKFQQKLSQFKEEVHWLLLDYEKNSLKKVYDYKKIIKSELNQRNKSIQSLSQFNEAITTEKNIIDDDILIANIKQCLLHITQQTMQIVSSLNELRKIYYYDFINGKYSKANNNSHELFEPCFLLKLNQKVQFAFNCEPLRSYLQIKGHYDPMLLELFSNETTDDDKKALIANCYVMLNEMIYGNYISNREKDCGNQLFSQHPKSNTKSLSKPKFNETHNRGTINTKKYINNPYINASNNSKGEEIGVMNSENNKSASKLSRIEEKASYKNEKDVIDCNRKDVKHTSQGANSVTNEKKNNSGKTIIISKPNEGDRKALAKLKPSAAESQSKALDEEITHLEFYTGTLPSIAKEYNHYYSLIPIPQRNTFNLHVDINKFTEGINPMLIVGFKNKELSSLCLLTFDPEDSHLLIIKQISSIERNINEVFLRIIMFLQDNLFYRELLIDLHFETEGNQYILNKDLADLFKGLNFKWSKLENSDNGKRIQTMKYKKATSNAKSTDDAHSLKQLCHIKAGMIAWVNEEKEYDDLLLNCAKNFNVLNSTVIDHLVKQSPKASEIKNSFNNLISFEGVKEEAIAFLKDNGCTEQELLSQFDSIREDQQLLLSFFSLHPMFKTLSTRTINQYIYNRLEIQSEVLYEKDTNQTFYMLQQDDYVILLGEISPGFKDYLERSKSIYEGFNSLYAKIEVILKDIRHIWVPSFSLQDISKSALRDENMTVINLDDAALDVIEYHQKAFSQEPNGNDCVIAGSFFFAVISVNLLNSFEILPIFCQVVDQIKWKMV